MGPGNSAPLPFRASESQAERCLPPLRRRPLSPIPFSRIPDLGAGAAAGAVGGDGDGAGRAAARYADVADTIAQTAARQGAALTCFIGLSRAPKPEGAAAAATHAQS